MKSDKNDTDASDANNWGVLGKRDSPDYADVIGRVLRIDLSNDDTIEKTIIPREESDSSNQGSAGYWDGKYTALVDGGSVVWDGEDITYRETSIMFDVDTYDVDNIEVIK